MKKLPIFLALAALGLVAYYMVYMRGKDFTISSSATKKAAIAKKSSLKDYTKIEVSGLFVVDVTYGSEESVTIDALDYVQKELELVVESGTLKIQFKSNALISTAGVVKIHVKTAKLSDFELSGISSITLNNPMKDETLTVQSSGSAKFKGAVDVETATIKLSGAANVELTGRAESADIELSGASHFSDYEFKTDNLNVDLSGASSTTITSLKSLSGKVSGASSLNYKGSPSIKNFKKSGAGSVNQN